MALGMRNVIYEKFNAVKVGDITWIYVNLKIEEQKEMSTHS